LPVGMAAAVDLVALDRLLTDQSYVSGANATQQDFAQWAAIKTCPEKQLHVARWWQHLAALKKMFPLKKWPAAEVEKKDGASRKEGGKCKDEANLENRLVNAVQGGVVTRFPPEPSGYLHIGHAKAALLNATYAEVYGGKVLLRFDDTNPSKEKMEYQEAILADMKLLGINHEPVTFSSDCIDELEKDMEKMLRNGFSYVDDTPAAQMKEERDAGIESKCRNQPLEENLRRWKEMLAGSEQGLTYACRAKIDMQCPNKCMRDPVFYRCKVDEPHHRHGFKYKAYPTYDFCCAIIDSRTGVTHALRSLEYSDRKAMYNWVLEVTGCKHVEISEFSRMNFDYTVLSKRKLTKLVDTGAVTGWDDPRMPTVRGVLRRGLTVEALKEFVMTQGASRNTNSMSWDKIWAINKQMIDPVIPRYCAIAEDQFVEFTLSDGPASPTVQKENLHPKFPEMGTKDMYLAKKVYVRQVDCQVLAPGEEITLMHWGNCFVEKINKKGDTVTSLEGRLHLEGSPKTTKYKLNWLAVMDGLIDVTLRELGFLFTKPTFVDEEDPLDYVNPKSQTDTKAKGEPAMLNLKKGDRLQVERAGYYIVDSVKPMILIEIPDGKEKKISGESRDDAWKGKEKEAKPAKEEKGGKAAEKENGAKGAAKEKGAKAAPAKAAGDRPLDDVSRVDIQVGKITKVWPHPDADKLWCEEIDIGRAQPLMVCSGLREHFTQEQMQDRMVVLIANMKPVKMRGVESQGMVLCSTGPSGVELLAPPAGSKPGERVFFEGYDGEPDEVLNTKTGKAPLEVIKPELKTNGTCEAMFKGAKFMTGAGIVRTASNKDSPIG